MPNNNTVDNLKIEIEFKQGSSVKDIKEVRQSLASLEAMTKELSSSLKGTIAPGDNFQETLADIKKTTEKVTEAVKPMKDEVSGVTKAISKANTPFRNFFKSVGRIAMYRMIRTGLKIITQAFREGINSAYQYSKIMGTSLAPALDNIATSSLYLKTSLGGLLAPLLETLAPAIEIVVNKFVDLLNIINQVFSALAGKTTWMKAIRQPKEYAANVNEAIKANQRWKASVLGIDELNIMQDMSSTAGGVLPGVDFASLYEIMPISETAFKIVDTLKEIWKYAKYIGVAFVAWKISSSVIRGIELIGNVFGLSGAAKGGMKVPSPKTVLTGLADMAIIIGGTTAIIVAIGELRKIPGFDSVVSAGIEQMVNIFSGIGKVLIPLVTVSAGMAMLGKVEIGTVLEGAGAAAAIIGVMTGIVVLLGEISKIPGAIKAVEDGGELLIKVTETFGRMGGSFVSGVSKQILTILPFAGEKLSEFMTNANPFFEGVKTIDAGTVGAVASLVASVTKITDSVILDSIFKWIAGESSLIKFAKSLNEFAPYMVKYSKTIKELDKQAVINSEIAINSVIALSKQIPKQGGLWGLITGGSKIGNFGKSLFEFGVYFKHYADAVKSISSSVVLKSADMAESLINIAKDIPKTGGLWSLIAGSASIGTFGKNLEAFGKSFKAYATYVAGVSGNVVEKSAAAASSMVALSQDIPKTGGVVSWFTGSSNIETFGKNLAAFGSYFAEYYSHISGITGSKIEEVSASIKSVVEFASKITSSIDSKAIKSFGSALQDFVGVLTKLPSSKKINFELAFVTPKNQAEKTIADYFNFTGFPQLKWATYAEGGLPPTGQMFVAREAGPELVGTIGSRTAVVNNEDIVASVSQGVYEANAEQNRLLREQNEILWQIYASESTVHAVVGTDNIISGLDRKNRRDGKTIVPVGV